MYGPFKASSSSVCLHAFHMSASTCDSLLCASQGLYFHGWWNREVFLWGQRQRPAAVALHRDRLSSIQFGFVIGSLGPEGHSASSNFALMHARCPIRAVFGHYDGLARPPSCRLSRQGPRRPLRWSHEQISVSPHMRSWFQDLFMLGRKTGTRVPTFHQTR